MEMLYRDSWYSGLIRFLNSYHLNKSSNYERIIIRRDKKIIRFRNVNKDRKKGEWYWKNQIEEMTSMKDSNIVASIVSGKYCPWDKNLLDNFNEIEFENHMFNDVEDYDTMLKSYYGDYMQLPPENERESNHVFKAYWKE